MASRCAWAGLMPFSAGLRALVAKIPILRYWWGLAARRTGPARCCKHCSHERKGAGSAAVSMTFS